MALPVKAVSSWNITPKWATLAWNIVTPEDNRFQGSMTWQVSELLGSSISHDDEPPLCFPGLSPVTAPLTCFLHGLWHLSLDVNHHLHIPEFQKCLYNSRGSCTCDPLTLALNAQSLQSDLTATPWCWASGCLGIAQTPFSHLKIQSLSCR